MTRTILNDNSTLKHLLAEAVNTFCYLQKRIYIRPILKKTPYELWERRKPNISYFHPFRCQCFILNTVEAKLHGESRVIQRCFDDNKDDNKR